MNCLQYNGVSFLREESILQKYHEKWVLGGWGLNRNAKNQIDRQQPIGKFRVKCENGISEKG